MNIKLDTNKIEEVLFNDFKYVHETLNKYGIDDDVIFEILTVVEGWGGCLVDAHMFVDAYIEAIKEVCTDEQIMKIRERQNRIYESKLLKKPNFKRRIKKKPADIIEFPDK